VTENRPLVSVVMPAYNEEKYIREAVESILAQSYRPTEILVVDDGSEDDTCTRLETFGGRITVFRQEHKGPAAARNLAVANAKGAFLAFADADDLWPEDKLERQLGHFLEDETLDIVLGTQKRIYAPDAKETGTGEMPPEEELIAHSLPGALIRRSAFERIGPFDESLIYAEDLDWFLRAREVGLNISVHREVVNIHRRHGANMTSNVAEVRRYTFKMFQKSLARRRKNPDLNYNPPKLSDFERG